MCFDRENNRQITEYPLYLHEDEKGNSEIIGRKGRKVRRLEMGGGIPEGYVVETVFNNDAEILELSENGIAVLEKMKAECEAGNAPKEAWLYVEYEDGYEEYIRLQSVSRADDGYLVFDFVVTYNSGTICIISVNKSDDEWYISMYNFAMTEVTT